MRIKFANMVFHGGLNVTCRRPGKYDDAKPGPVTLESIDGRETKEAELRHVETYPRVSDIPQALLDREHDPSCKTHEGLLAELKRVYGEYDDEDGATVVLLQVST